MSVRQIRSDGWVFRTAYFFTDEDKLPKKINLCRFVWRVVFMMLLSLVVACIVVFVLFCAGFILYKVGLGIWWLMTEFRWGSIVGMAAGHQTAVLWYSPLVYVLGVGYLGYLMFAPPYIRRWLTKSEIARLARDYVRAKKEKVCPMYKVVEGGRG